MRKTFKMKMKYCIKWQSWFMYSHFEDISIAREEQMIREKSPKSMHWGKIDKYIFEGMWGVLGRLNQK